MEQAVNPVLEESWKKILAEEFRQDYFIRLKEFLIAEKSAHIVYPPGPLIFSAFANSPFHDVKVVLLGQDPYHGKGQAHGLCFSVPHGITPPPSLKNIFKEINTDMGIAMPSHGNLTSWARQGVLLLNATLTVRAGTPGSHQGRGWETFTDAVIRALNDKREGLVFLLWGKYAQAKAGLIDEAKHLVLKAAHPSPYSAAAGFFGCRHFSMTNEYLARQGKDEIMWSLPGN